MRVARCCCLGLVIVFVSQLLWGGSFQCATNPCTVGKITISSFNSISTPSPFFEFFLRGTGGPSGVTLYGGYAGPLNGIDNAAEYSFDFTISSSDPAVTLIASSFFIDANTQLGSHWYDSATITGEETINGLTAYATNTAIIPADVHKLNSIGANVTLPGVQSASGHFDLLLSSTGDPPGVTSPGIKANWGYLDFRFSGDTGIPVPEPHSGILLLLGFTLMSRVAGLRNNTKSP